MKATNTTMPASVVPPPFMGTPFDNAPSTDDVGDGLNATEKQAQSSPNHFEMRSSQSYKSPFEMMDLPFHEADSQEYD
jgi:hypothetical protein